VSDTIIIAPGYDFELNVLHNDYSPVGDSMYISFVSFFHVISDSSVQARVEWDDYQSMYKGVITGKYFLSDTLPWISGLFDIGNIVAVIEHVDFYDSLDVNNVNALLNCFGNHFWDLPGGQGARFFVPNGGLTSSVFSQTFWIGGLDLDDSLHLAGDRYRQVGMDYWHGPLSDVYDSAYDRRWFHIWKLNKAEIENHKQNWWTPGYICPEQILTWPGNGDTGNGQAAMLAPFLDQNHNGIYEPMQGDYPVIRGDQEVFFIFNDGREPHTETEGRILGIEVHGSAYAFDAPEDSALWNTIFLHYDIINRSQNTYHDTYLGIFTDLDLGYAWDDFIGCNVQGGYYYCYNGNPIDGGGQPWAYGEHPPAMGVLFLAGPEMDPDGIDNPAGGCDLSINGLNFGDTIIDNERMGLIRFIHYLNSGGVQGDPQIADEYYSSMKGFWKDGTPLLFGGNGHAGSGAVGPECAFMFPDDSDPCNWGTGGILPNGGFNQNGYYWNETTAANNPDDRRGLGVSGPFTFASDETKQLDLAMVFGRDFNGTPLSSVQVLEQRCEYLKSMFENDPDFFSKTEEYPNEVFNLRVYPNPTTGHIYIDGLPSGRLMHFSFHDMFGNNLLESERMTTGRELINTGAQSPGLYFLKITLDDRQKVLKILVR
ncbi:MAG: T9SS type A sorting domain-containing protein, partial [Bacteroidales bacterium]|nr:T9SS type A sorting domain-containing protein [Bacteroidales bacterium]